MAELPSFTIERPANEWHFNSVDGGLIVQPRPEYRQRWGIMRAGLVCRRDVILGRAQWIRRHHDRQLQFYLFLETLRLDDKLQAIKQITLLVSHVRILCDEILKKTRCVTVISIRWFVFVSCLIEIEISARNLYSMRCLRKCLMRRGWWRHLHCRARDLRDN